MAVVHNHQLSAIDGVSFEKGGLQKVHIHAGDPVDANALRAGGFTFPMICAATEVVRLHLGDHLPVHGLRARLGLVAACPGAQFLLM